jgi:hypothetical protein
LGRKRSGSRSIMVADARPHISLFEGIRGVDRRSLPREVLAGVILAALTIPMNIKVEGPNKRDVFIVPKAWRGEPPEPATE